MFYYLIYNSSFIDKKQTDDTIKIMIYGTICYILLHGLISSLPLLSGFRNYFWMLAALDISSMYYLLQNKNGILDIKTTTYEEPELKKEEPIVRTEPVKPKQKKVTFDLKEDLENIKMEIKDTLISNNKEKLLENMKKQKTIISESDTDFGSDIDMDAFEKTLD